MLAFGTTAAAASAADADRVQKSRARAGHAAEAEVVPPAFDPAERARLAAKLCGAGRAR
jgi:hypothetical protein